MNMISGFLHTAILLGNMILVMNVELWHAESAVMILYWTLLIASIHHIKINQQLKSVYLSRNPVDNVESIYHLLNVIDNHPTLNRFHVIKFVARV